MKKILLILLAPFFMKAQNSLQKSTDTANDPANEKTTVKYEGAKKKAYDLIKSYRERALQGENFSTLAALYSEDPGSAKQGGVYKDVVKGMMVPEFESVAFSLKPGDISEVFETQYGFHFMQLIARHGDAVDVRHILVMPK